MPIIIARATGEILSAPQYTQEQKNRAWEIIAREWCTQHPQEVIAQNTLDQEQEPGN